MGESGEGGGTGGGEGGGGDGGGDGSGGEGGGEAGIAGGGSGGTTPTMLMMGCNLRRCSRAAAECPQSVAWPVCSKPEERVKLRSDVLTRRRGADTAHTQRDGLHTRHLLESAHTNKHRHLFLSLT